MLKIAYEGKGYDVINDYTISDEELTEQISKHDMIVMFGHGTPEGLIAWNWETRESRYIINDSHADLLRTKKTYSMWCNSDEYFSRHDMKGFHSGMIITEEFEAYMFGIIEYLNEEIVESLTPLMNAMRDTLEMDDLQEMKRIILERYNADDAITQFNRNNIIVL